MLVGSNVKSESVESSAIFHQKLGSAGGSQIQHEVSPLEKKSPSAEGSTDFRKGLRKPIWKDNWEFSKSSLMINETEAKRQQVIWELFITEESYIKDIKMIIDFFMKPISEKKILNEKTVNAIFSNLEKIFEVNEVMY